MRQALVAAATAVAVWIGVASGAVAQAQQERRVALVVGNDSYQNTRPLRNGGNDARAVAAALQRLNFDVVASINQGKREMDRALAAFARRAAGADVGLFFFAGHGIQAAGNNYLMPTDANPQDELDLRAEAVDLREVFEAVSGAQLRLVLLDACRNNPMADSMRAQSVDRSRACPR